MSETQSSSIWYYKRLADAESMWILAIHCRIFKINWLATSFCLPRVPFVNCRQFMYLVISLLVLRAGYGIWLYQFLIIAYLFTFLVNLIPWFVATCNEYFLRVTVIPFAVRNSITKGKCLLITNYQGKTIHKQNGCIYGISIYLETASFQINWAARSKAIRINLHLLYKLFWLYVYMAVPILQDVCSSDCAINLMAGIETGRLVSLPSCWNPVLIQRGAPNRRISSYNVRRNSAFCFVFDWFTIFYS